MTNNNVLDQFIEIKLKSPEQFLVVKETLTRIGVAAKQDKKLYQSVHILHKMGRYYLVHFKQMFLLDGKTDNFTKSDRERLNTIAKMLVDWKIVELANSSEELLPRCPASLIKVIPFSEKSEWELISKYNIGMIKKGENNA